ncbi:nucleotidyltransferase family protein [Palleronia sediminis]|uniref:Nucleotidyltransferase family protein n=1 Tax=Palleronia sediminis TaxID=2547833 RepID=A0A4R6AKB9_9RHOB|nr:nucleotidyltransferase family protein [Palleronia sediminis]TDL83634.1 nucleotidyltransferase family protein [Palleronia sediminis]
MTDRLCVAILAAGASRRMRGRDKLLEPVDGVPILRKTALRALALGLPVTITLPPDAPRRAAALDGLPVERRIVAAAHEGMSASLRVLSGYGGPMMIVLADMPEIGVAEMAALVSAFDKAGGTRPVRAATETGRAGQPVVFPARLVTRFATLTGDMGARQLLEGEEVVSVPLPGDRAILDLDTPEAWEAWRARRP